MSELHYYLAFRRSDNRQHPSEGIERHDEIAKRSRKLCSSLTRPTYRRRRRRKRGGCANGGNSFVDDTIAFCCRRRAVVVAITVAFRRKLSFVVARRREEFPSPLRTRGAIKILLSLTEQQASYELLLKPAVDFCCQGRFCTSQQIVFLFHQHSRHSDSWLVNAGPSAPVSALPRLCADNSLFVLLLLFKHDPTSAIHAT